MRATAIVLMVSGFILNGQVRESAATIFCCCIILIGAALWYADKRRLKRERGQ